MPKIYPIYFYLLLAFCFLSSGCNEKKNISMKRHAVNINIVEEPASLDPRKARDVYSLAILRMLFEGLTRMGTDEKAQLALADSVEISEDFKTYTFHLRPAQWTNGKRVTSQDFIYSWKRSLSPDFNSSQSFLMYPVKNARAFKEKRVSFENVGIRAIDDSTLAIELENPLSYFLELLANPIFFPVYRNIDEEVPDWTHSVETYVANGPFHLEEWKHHDHLTLQKNGQYWDSGAVKLCGIQLLMVRNDVEYQMFEQGDLDWAGSPLSTLPIDTLREVKERDAFGSKPFLATSFLRLNTKKLPFSNLAFRRAFSIAVQREEIVQHILDGNHIPATALVPPVFSLHTQSLIPEGDIAAVQRAWDLGRKELEGQVPQLPIIRLTYVQTARNHIIVQALQEQWRKSLGLSIELEPLESKVYFDRLGKGEFDCILSSWVADVQDPSNFLEIFENKNNIANHTGWENGEYKRLLQEARFCSNDIKRNACLKKSEEILIQEMPIVPIYHTKMLFLQNPHLKNVVLTSKGDIDFKWAEFVEAL